MGKIIRMSESEFFARKGISDEELTAMLEAAPEFSSEEMGLEPLVGEPIARGFDEFKEYLKKREMEAHEEPEVSISVRIPRSYARGLRATGRGWRNRVGEYLINGIKRGDLGKI